MEIRDEYEGYSITGRVWAILAYEDGRRVSHKKVARTHRVLWDSDITPQQISWAVYWLRLKMLAKKEGRARACALFPLGHDPEEYLEFFRPIKGVSWPDKVIEEGGSDLPPVPPLERRKSNQPI